MKRLPAAVSILFLLLTLSACSGYYELQNEMVIEAVGIDLADDGKILVTVQALNTEDYPSGDGGSSSGQISTVYQTTGSTVDEALSCLALTTGKTPIYSHNRLIVFGDLISKKKSIGDFIDFFIRSSQPRDNVLLAAAEADAADVVSAQIGEGMLPAKTAEEIILSGEKNGLCTAVRLYRFMNMYSDMCRCEYLPVLTIKDGRDEDKKMIEAVGTLLTKDGKYCMTLNREETRIFMLMQTGLDNGLIKTDCDDASVSLNVIASKPKIKTDTTSGEPHITVDLICYCDIAEFRYNKDGMDKKTIQRICEQAQSHVTQQMDRLLYKTSVSEGLDILNLYAKFLQNETDYFKATVEASDEKEKAENWKNELQRLLIDFKVDVVIRSPGQNSFHD